MKRKKMGYMAWQVMIAMIACMMASYGLFLSFSSGFGMLAATKDAVSAQQYAEITANTLRLCNYDDLDDQIHDRQPITVIENPDGWEDEIILGDEKDMADGTNFYRIATVNIYKDTDTTPRFTLNVPLSSQDASSSDSLPIGTIIAYNGPLYAIPVGWHLCDGSDGTPDLRGRFLEGSVAAGIFIKAGLPNITGSVHFVSGGSSFGRTPWGYSYTGAFKSTINASGTASWQNQHSGTGGYTDFYFNASDSNVIYGGSDTVQPAAYTVYYIIKIS